jgi:Phosphoglycerate dehydrogenase and related dehydrogenases
MKFIQSGYAGMYAPFLQAFLKESQSVIANASSIYGKHMSHYVLAHMLRWNKRIDDHAIMQKEKEWMPNGWSR